jgi:hypothetical protein
MAYIYDAGSFVEDFPLKRTNALWVSATLQKEGQIILLE